MRHADPRPALPPLRQRGFALLIVLWSTVMLALLATQITAAGRSELQLAGNLREAAAAEAAADAGVAIAIFHVLDPASPWGADAAIHAETFGRFRLAIQVLDENGKLNPNRAPMDLLAQLMVADGADAGSARNAAAGIGDWRAAASLQKTQQYRAAGRTLAPTGQPFRSVAELGLVLGMTPQLLSRLAPHLSVYADANIEYAHADPILQTVLRANGGGSGGGPEARPTAVTVVATATDAQGGRFTRRATLSFVQDRTGRLYRILAWRTEAPD